MSMWTVGQHYKHWLAISKPYKLTKDAVIILNNAGKTNLLTLKWIQAHVGHKGNKR